MSTQNTNNNRRRNKNKNQQMNQNNKMAPKIDNLTDKIDKLVQVTDETKKQLAAEKRARKNESKKFRRQAAFDTNFSNIFPSIPLKNPTLNSDYFASSNPMRSQEIRTGLMSTIKGYNQPGPLSDKLLSYAQNAGKYNFTPHGLEFLKCAFASPDFSGESSHGIPDGEKSVRLMKSHKSYETFSVPPQTTSFLVKLPIPGASYFICQVPVGTPFLNTSTLRGTAYQGYENLFSNDPTIMTRNVTGFRIVSNNLELVSTTNQMNWFGDILAFKTKLSFTKNNATVGTNSMISVLNGLDALNATQARNYIAPSNLGVYIIGYNSTKAWNTFDVQENLASLPSNASASMFGNVQLFANDGSARVPLSGYDGGFDCSVIKVSNPSDVAQSFILRTWQCVEYELNSNSDYVSFGMTSPDLDVDALEAYHDICDSLPVAVTYAENNIWDTITSIIGGAANMIIPGSGSLIGGLGSIIKGVVSGGKTRVKEATSQAIDNFDLNKIPADLINAILQRFSPQVRQSFPDGNYIA